MTLVTEGPAAAWEKIKEQLANLQGHGRSSGIIDFVVDMIVQKAIPKLRRHVHPRRGLHPGDHLDLRHDHVLREQDLKQIIQVVTAFIDSIAAIAAGAIGAAANKVESTLAGLLSLAISFLAGFAGLGKVADKSWASSRRSAPRSTRRSTR